MANSITFVPLLFLIFTTFYYTGEATSFVVGGPSHGWKVPQPPSQSLNHWAEASRFKVGDVLVFNYDANHDSVLQVTKENYESCNVEKPLKDYIDKSGSSSVTLDRSGAHYYISGDHWSCIQGEKLIVVVLQSNGHTKPVPASPPSKPPTTNPTLPATPPPTPSTPPTSPPAPAPAPAHNAAFGMVVGNGIFLTFVAVIGLALA